MTTIFEGAAGQVVPRVAAERAIRELRAAWTNSQVQGQRPVTDQLTRQENVLFFCLLTQGATPETATQRALDLAVSNVPVDQVLVSWPTATVAEVARRLLLKGAEFSTGDLNVLLGCLGLVADADPALAPQATSAALILQKLLKR